MGTNPLARLRARAEDRETEEEGQGTGTRRDNMTEDEGGHQWESTEEERDEDMEDPSLMQQTPPWERGSRGRARTPPRGSRRGPEGRDRTRRSASSRPTGSDGNDHRPWRRAEERGRAVTSTASTMSVRDQAGQGSRTSVFYQRTGATMRGIAFWKWQICSHCRRHGPMELLRLPCKTSGRPSKPCWSSFFEILREP